MPFAVYASPNSFFSSSFCHNPLSIFLMLLNQMGFFSPDFSTSIFFSIIFFSTSFLSETLLHPLFLSDSNPHSTELHLGFPVAFLIFLISLRIFYFASRPLNILVLCNRAPCLPFLELNLRFLVNTVFSGIRWLRELLL